jgi:antibiotic biosynthesis monooxygenase (ABM) superfamily enzyme
MLNENETTALIIEHKVRAGAEKRYEKWLGEILEFTKKSPGYLGREIFPPSAAGEPYLVIVRFRSEKDLQNWLDSKEREAAIARMHGEFEEGDKTEVRAGIDVWFTPKNAAHKPRPYKQFLLATAAIYPLSLIVPRLLAPLFEFAPPLKHPLLAGLIITAIIVGLMTYLVMPFLTTHLRGWLFEKENKPQ